MRIPTYRLFKEKITELQNIASRKYDRGSTVSRAYRDGSGNNIADTYATKDYVDSKMPALSGCYGVRNGNWSIYGYWNVLNVGSDVTATAVSSVTTGQDPHTYPISNSDLRSGSAYIETSYNIDIKDLSVRLDLSNGQVFQLERRW